MEKIRIVVLDSYALCAGELCFARLEKMGDLRVYERTPQELAVERIGDAQIVLTNKVLITREVMEACKEIRYIGVTATGYNVVDVQAAAQRGIVVTNVPAYSTQAVAQHVLALLLHSLSHVANYDACVKQGKWISSRDFCFYDAPMEELSGKTMGIVGFGSIGQSVARIALAMDVHVLVHTPHPKPEWEERGVRFVSLDELLAESDILTLHCPLTEQTRGMLGKAAIAQMKKGVRVINTARGPLVDEEAMRCGKDGWHAIWRMCSAQSRPLRTIRFCRLPTRSSPLMWPGRPGRHANGCLPSRRKTCMRFLKENRFMWCAHEQKAARHCL